MSCGIDDSSQVRFDPNLCDFYWILAFLFANERVSNLLFPSRRDI